MKTFPVLFSTPMVKQIREDQKDVTRRIAWLNVTDGDIEDFNNGIDSGSGIVCKYGGAGDCLWVKETFRITGYTGDMQYAIGYKDGTEEISKREGLTFEEYNSYFKDGWFGADPENKWRPSIFMRNAFSRFDLHILSVRIERLQDISEDDAHREGVASVAEYKYLWSKLNAKRAPWESNPFVWRIQFNMVES